MSKADAKEKEIRKLMGVVFDLCCGDIKRNNRKVKSFTVFYYNGDLYFDYQVVYHKGMFLSNTGWVSWKRRAIFMVRYYLNKRLLDAWPTQYTALAGKQYRMVWKRDLKRNTKRIYVCGK